VRNYVKNRIALVATAGMALTLAACHGVDVIPLSELEQLQRLAKTCPATASTTSRT
jgi:hypothetical protein